MSVATLGTARHRDALATVGAFFMRDSRIAMSYSTAFWLSWVGVVVDVAVAWFIGSLVQPSTKFGYDGKPHPYFDYLVINTAFLRFQSAAVQTFSLAIRDGQTMGTLEVLLATPTSLATIVLSSGTYLIVYQLAQSFVYIAFALLFGLQASHVNLATLGVFLVLTVVAIVPIGVMSAAATMSFKKTGPLEFMITSLTQLFGGIYLPTSSLPGALRWIGEILPITHALNGLRAALQGAPITAVMPDVIWLAAISIVFLPASLLLFNLAVGRARVDGTLGQY